MADTNVSVDDLKIMYADAQIKLVDMCRQVMRLQDENAALRAQLKPKPAAEKKAK